MGKILLGIATVFPFILMVLYVLSFFPMAFIAHEPGDMSDPSLGIFSIGLTLILFILMMVSSIALFVYYLVHVVNNSRLDSSNRLIWALVILFFANIGYLVYWYFQIWKEEDDRVEHNYLN
ncbi:MAG: PLDc N-terminal domain-containing protein [Flavobacteriales bacterium]|nr:PLDc N-terminal domain-containing protein [Flavobacteriales bacterium]